jgi:hypothetical protein
MTILRTVTSQAEGKDWSPVKNIRIGLMGPLPPLGEGWPTRRGNKRIYWRTKAWK